MLPYKIATRYAEALSEIACERDKVEQWEKELTEVSEVLDSLPDLATFLAYPEIPRSRKEAVVRKAFEGRISTEILALLLLLIQYGRDPDLEPILQAFRESTCRRLRILPVAVSTALPLTESQADVLVALLERQTGLSIKLERHVDPELIAGMTLTAGDRFTDASARTTLEELRSAAAKF
jgi:F-type H+-transporting ATPase subunit delta